MEFILKNPIKSEKSTISELYCNNRFVCHILEDKIRTIKVYGQTAIPAGRYKVSITPSKRFKRSLPLLWNVPGFLGIRIHSGNDAEDTEGCLIPGNYSPLQKDWVSNSRIEFQRIYTLIAQAEHDKEAIHITIQR